MKAFVNSAKDAINRTVNAADATVLFREMRDPDGDWQNGSVYLIDVRESVSVPGVMTSEPEGQFQVVNHGKYLKSLYGDYIGDISLMNAAGETLGNLARAAKDDPAGNAVCTSSTAGARTALTGGPAPSRMRLPTLTGK